MVTRSPAGIGTGVSISSDSATVENGTIERFGTGISSIAFLMRLGRNSLLGLVVQHNNGKGIVVCCNPVTIHATTVRSNSNTGIEIGFSNRSVVGGSLISRNGGDGIYMAAESSGTFTNNVITNNGGNGLSTFTSSARVIGNYASGNGGNGMILIDDQGGAEAFDFIASNTANSNGKLGIFACRQDFSGPIVCLPMIDGGGNSASLNGDPRQCVNIVYATHGRGH